MKYLSIAPAHALADTDYPKPENILLGESGGSMLGISMLDAPPDGANELGRISDDELTELLYTLRGNVGIRLRAHLKRNIRLTLLRFSPSQPWQLSYVLGIGARDGALMKYLYGRASDFYTSYS